MVSGSQWGARVTWPAGANGEQEGGSRGQREAMGGEGHVASESQWRPRRRVMWSAGANGERGGGSAGDSGEKGHVVRSSQREARGRNRGVNGSSQERMKVTWSAEANGERGWGSWGQWEPMWMETIGHGVSRSQGEQRGVTGSAGANGECERKPRGQEKPMGSERELQWVSRTQQSKGHVVSKSQWGARIKVTGPAGANGERR